MGYRYVGELRQTENVLKRSCKKHGKRRMSGSSQISSLTADSRDCVQQVCLQVNIRRGLRGNLTGLTLLGALSAHSCSTVPPMCQVPDVIKTTLRPGGGQSGGI